MKTLIKVIIAFTLLSVLYFLLYKGYELKWTGFNGYTNTKGEFIPPKKLWDWLQLLIIPFLLAICVWWLNKSQKKSEQHIETDRQQQKALEGYFDCMTDLLLDKNLRLSKDQRTRDIARTRTLSVLRILDGGRKGQVIQFLYESDLINKNPMVQLNGADLTDAKLNDAVLRGVELRGIYFNNAHFKAANFEDADLRGSDFSCADLSDAKMTNANLKQAILKNAKLRKTDLIDATLDQVDFTDVNLKNSKLSNP